MNNEMHINVVAQIYSRTRLWRRSLVERSFIVQLVERSFIVQLVERRVLLYSWL